METDWPLSLGRPEPGQFVMVRARAATDPLWRRPLAIHDFRGRKQGASASLLYQVVGPTTRDLAALTPGSALDMLGPLGRGFALEGREHWLVAGGRGIAPLFYLARRLKSEGRAGRVIIGGRISTHVLKTRELSRMGFALELATEDGSRGHRGLATDLLERRLGEITRHHCRRVVISACGPEGMLRMVAGLAARFQVRAEVSIDTLMACGQGICLGCAVRSQSGYRLACVEGPVFRTEELVL